MSKLWTSFLLSHLLVLIVYIVVMYFMISDSIQSLVEAGVL